jgi:ribose transport system ATP-binding protein
MADRIIIMKNGRQSGEFERSEVLKDTDLIAKMV